MKYKLYNGGNNDTSNVIKEVLKNRGIEDYKKYLNLDSSVLIPYNKLDDIDLATECFMEHFNNKDKVGILVDEDPDGFCSASMMYLYIKRLDENYPVNYILHTKAKAHGLSDDVNIDDDIKLLIIPDAGTNDVMECYNLNNKMDIIILDHHELEPSSEMQVLHNKDLSQEGYRTIVVNNQMSKDYSNKDLCGAGVVYKFLLSLDEETWNEYADDYLDLCALANISDVMDMRTYETRYIVNKGLSNIKNKCLSAFIKAQDYSMNGKINIHNIQWYITPVLNGMIRIGSQEEKELLFKAFVEQDEYFEYKTRAKKDKESETIQESIYDRSARLSKNAKSRQDKLKEKSVAQIVEIANQLPFDDKVVIVETSDILESGLTGVVAIKIAEIFNKPCILLNKYLDKKLGKIIYGGSARNIDHSPIDSFKDVINSSDTFNWGKGHPQAFGINLDVDKKNEAINSLNNILKDIEYDATYKVDFIFDINELNIKHISDLTKFENIIGQGINEPLIAIENIRMSRDSFEIFGKNTDTLSFMLNDIKYVQFKCNEENKLYNWLNNCWDETEEIIFTVVGKPSINEYQGNKTMQIIIEDLNVIEIVKQDDEEDEEW